MRATRCGKNNFEEGIVYRHYGSVCWYMKGCLEYTKSGLCEKCLEGYYLAEDQTCKPCKKTCDNDTYCNNLIYILLIISSPIYAFYYY